MKKKPEEPEKKVDLWDHPEVKALLGHAEDEMFPILQGSAVSIAICDGTVDAKLALELGAILLFDKPLILVVSKDHPVPARLLRIADAVIDLEDWKNNPEKARQTVAEAIMKVNARYPGGKRTP